MASGATTTARLVAVVAALCIAAAAARAERREAWDPARLRAWIDAVESHEPGRLDAALLTAAGWSNEDLRAIWIDSQAAILVARDPKAALVVAEIDPTSVLADSRAIRRKSASPYGVRRLAFDRDERRALEELAARVQAIGPDAVIRRGAVLHTDVLTLAARQAVEAMGTSAMRAPRGLLIDDGRSAGLAAITGHRPYTRMLLEKLAPAAAAFERDWYRATLALDQGVEWFDTAHLERALRRFPDDAVVNLLAGCQYEAFASPLFQEFARSFRDRSLSPGIRNADGELEAAARHFRRAMAEDGGAIEARLRLANVLAQQGHHDDAVRELASLGAAPDPGLAYYVALFLGRSQEALGALAAAADAYGRAVRAMPDARVPRLALARIALEQGDRAAMAEHLDGAVQRVTMDTAIDPWWEYRHMQGRHGPAWLDALRAAAARP